MLELGKFTKFKLHKTGAGTNAAKLESVEFPGKYPAVQPKGIAIGTGGKWTQFIFYKQGQSGSSEIEQLRQRLQSLEQQNKSLQSQVESLKASRNNNAAKSHSQGFWDEFDQNYAEIQMVLNH